MNVEKIKTQVKKAISRFGQDITIKRNGTNDYGEPEGEATVTTIKGYFHKGNTSLGVSISEGAKVTTNQSEKLMVVYDVEAQKVLTGDFFYLNNIKYEIVDLGLNFNIYADMSLKRM